MRSLKAARPAAERSARGQRTRSRKASTTQSNGITDGRRRRECHCRVCCLAGRCLQFHVRNFQAQTVVLNGFKTGRLRRLQFLDELTLSAAHRASFRRIVENAESSAYAKSAAFSLGVLGHILRIILRLAIVRGNLVLPRMPRIFGQNGSYQRPCRGIFVPRLQPALTIARRSHFR
jgi:hypothetical protein